MPPPSTRENLIATTQALLWERGYAATSPRSILDGAGVGQGSMYHHFTGKESLALAAFERSAAGIVERASAALHDDGSPAISRLESYLLLERDVLRGCPVGRMAGDAEVLASQTLGRVLADAFERITALTVVVVEQAVVDGELPVDTDAAALAETILAVVQGGYVLARAADDPAPFELAVRGMVSLLRAGRRT